jgi:hypothetical protein
VNIKINNVMNMGIKLYNKIPNKIREVGKMRQFKRVFRSYLVQHVFYFGRGIYVKLRLLVIGIRIVCLYMYNVSYVGSLTRKEE